MKTVQEDLKTLPKLCSRELEVLTLTTHGFEDKHIAEFLSISKATVPTYISRLRSKLGVSTRAQLGATAESQGITQGSRRIA
jgi:two-component system invasion response regulator UvrY